MSIRIEVSGDSLPEIADKLLALAGQFSKQALPFDPPAAPVEDKPKRKPKAKAEEPQDEVGNAETAQTADAPSPTSNGEPDTKTAGTAQAPSDAQFLSEASDDEQDRYFDANVAPVVIEAIQRGSRESVVEVLAEFGAERARLVNPAQWPELVERLKAL